MRRLSSPGWIVVHLAVAALVTSFLLLGWWQMQRAAGGNMLSFGYAIQWPVFAAFVVFVWIKEARRAVRQPSTAQDELEPPVGEVTRSQHEVPSQHELPSQPGWPSHHERTTRSRPARPVRPRHAGPAYDDTGDEALAAYNRYLAWLNAHPHRSPTEYPG